MRLTSFKPDLLIYLMFICSLVLQVPELKLELNEE